MKRQASAISRLLAQRSERPGEMHSLKDPQRFREIAEAIETSSSFVLSCHVRPDGDAIGSMLAMGIALEQAGRDVTLYTQDSIPKVLDFLPGIESIVHELPDPLPELTTLLVLDCSEPHRIGNQHKRLVEQAHRIIVLDHHLGRNKAFEHSRCLSYVDPDVFATGALVFRLLEELSWPITEAIATNLYAAILTDTGCFRHSNTTEEAFYIAQVLVALGADPCKVATNLYQRYPLRRMELLGLVLRTLEVRSKGRIALLQATPEMFRVSGALEEDTEDFVAYARCIDTVELAIFIREVRTGQVSVSLRSKSWVNVAEIAKRFGGGGHLRAAGFRFTGTAPEIRQRLLQEVESLFGLD